eukprot:CAMPEP_0175079188 /NCGR_PEP_ID=MMETSP0052_2-20121109/24668_1 /TAXON_ID=51329 ORGANISM="Polytomella parva, Strain SAG 63-3" /NCGR_SAMPLE_ID=MMETSP0052_2 /ASSEMBLY_ACC=CAM_ASM_000194 /LENGTH=359 /DNA_ID=CAMNT_0016349459 /DNA_START=228 /DNA_END=1307 /DNA_ORIENTATION=-
MTLFAVPCAALNIIAMDISGTFQDDQSVTSAQLDLHRHRVDSKGKRIGHDEFHVPPTQRLINAGVFGNIVAVDIHEAMMRAHEAETESDHHEGCRVFGRIRVRRVAGKIVIAAQKDSVLNMLALSSFFKLDGGINSTSSHVPHLQALTNISHVIKHLSFGPRVPGTQNPLDGEQFVSRQGEEVGSVKYYIKVVPTQYYGRIGRAVETHQYAVTEYVAPLNNAAGNSAPSVPTVEFHFDNSPIMMTINERPPSFLHFLVRMSAVIGGAVAVTGMLEKVVAFIIRVHNKWNNPAASSIDMASSTSPTFKPRSDKPASMYGGEPSTRTPSLGTGGGTYGSDAPPRSRPNVGAIPYGSSGSWY